MTIFGVTIPYQPFWVIVTCVVCAFFGSLLWWIGYQIARLTDVFIESNKQEAEWQKNFANELDREAEDQVEDALDEKLK